MFHQTFPGFTFTSFHIGLPGFSRLYIYQAHDLEAAICRDDDGPVGGSPLDVDGLGDQILAGPQLVDDVALLRVPDRHRVRVQDQELHVAAARSKPDLLDLENNVLF